MKMSERVRELKEKRPKVVNWKDWPCWIWPRALNWYGYGICGRKDCHSLVHIDLYVRYRGPIPEGKELDHLCRHTECVNPWHMQLVTHKVNIRRGVVQTKLAHKQVVVIRKMKGKGFKAKAIGKRFGVSSHTVYLIWRGVVHHRKYRKEGIGKWQRK